jgi:hypothetical protein
MLHELATWAFMAGCGLGLWWLYLMWPLYQVSGPIVMFTEGPKHWQLYTVWICWALSLALYVTGEKQKNQNR